MLWQPARRPRMLFGQKAHLLQLSAALRQLSKVALCAADLFRIEIDLTERIYRTKESRRRIGVYALRNKRLVNQVELSCLESGRETNRVFYLS